MSRPETCRIAATPADYQRYGIAKDEIAAREDGFRTRPGGPGTFEWWYFDAVLDDGSTLVINFMVKDIRGGRGIRQPARPVVTFELDRPDGTHVERALHAQDDFAFAADRCDVRVGACTFAGDLHTYRIHLDLDAVTADVTLTGQVPSWRPETGHILFGDDQPKLFAWLPSVPQGAVRATLTVDGGYCDASMSTRGSTSALGPTNMSITCSVMPMRQPRRSAGSASSPGGSARCSRAASSRSSLVGQRR